MSAHFLRNVLILSALTPLVTMGAGITFVEVVGDPPGTDTHHEYIRIHTDTELNLTGWTVAEGGVNHKIKPLSTSVIPAGGYAVIADDAVTHATEHPSTDVLFDSAFSIKNTGEHIALKNASSTVMAETDFVPAPKVAKPAATKSKPVAAFKKQVPLLQRATTSDAAAVTLAPGDAEHNMWPWVSGAVLLAVVGGVVLMSVTKQSAGKYEIIDTSDNLL